MDQSVLFAKFQISPLQRALWLNLFQEQDQSDHGPPLITPFSFREIFFRFEGYSDQQYWQDDF